MSANVMQAKNGRFYQADGVWVPSVTTILSVYPKSERFDRWLGESSSYEEAIAKRNAAGDRGTQVHDAIARLIRGEEVDLTDADPKVAKLTQGFVNWYEATKPRVIASEIFVHGDGYAGTCDLVCEIDGEVWVIDYKTSAAVYTSYHLQTAAYAEAWVEMNPPACVDRRGILWLKTSTKKGWQLVESDEPFATDLAAFQSCKAIYHREHGYEPIPYKQPNDEPVILRLGKEE